MLLFTRILICLFSFMKLLKAQTNNSESTGYLHYCKKGTDCKDLVPKALGCVALLQGGSRCFFYKDLNLQGSKTLSFNFNN
jgi:hypothetical protein